MIAQSQISKLANRLFDENGRKGRRIPEAVLERDYCLAWFLVGLARSPLKEKLVFKGGTALRRCHFDDYRFSEDLDFTLLNSAMTFEELKKELETVYATVKAAANISFAFSRPDSTSHKNCHTFYLSYEGPLPKTASTKEVKVDVTIKEEIVNAPDDLSVLKNCIEYHDLPEGEKIKVYSVLEIATEKIVALLDRARTEPRDLYDLWQLTEETKKVNLNECLPGVHAKLKFRGKVLGDVRADFEKKESQLKTKWETRLSAQMAILPKFDVVFRAVKRQLRQAKITGNL